MPDRLFPAVAAAAALLAAGPAAAQQDREAQPVPDHGDNAMFAPLMWQIEDLYAGWRASRVLGADVISRNGERLGSVADIVLDYFNEADYLVIAVTEDLAGDGSLRYAVNWGRTEAGDTWTRVEATDYWERTEATEQWPGTMVVDTTRDIVAQAIDTVPADNLDVREEANVGWRVSELMEAPVDMDGEAPFGVVDDVIFNSDDVVEGIVVRGTGPLEGYYGVPWEQVVVEHDANVLSVPLSLLDVEDLPEFDYARMTDEARPND